jgi:Right handed beta helix region
MQRNQMPDAPSKIARPVLVTLVLALSGCGQLLGADEYGFADDGSRENPCAADHVPTDGGGCAFVGARVCALGFEAHPESGCTATLPETDCEDGKAAVGSARCSIPVDNKCEDHFPGLGNLSGVSVVYADAAAAPGGTGTRDLPFKTIAAALDAADVGRPVQLLIKGDFLEDVAITRPDVTIKSCVGEAKIIGQNPTQTPEDPCFPKELEKLKIFRRAAVCLTSGIEKVTLEGFEITGAGDGVGIAGAKKVVLHNVRIQDTAYFGVRIFDESDVSLESVAIYRAHGAGVQLLGSKLVITDSSIQHTVPLNDWADDPLRKDSPEANKVPEQFRVGWARGVSIHPGVWPRDPSRAAPEDFAQSEVTIKESVLTGHKEMAVFAAGANLTLDEVFLGATSAGEGSGRGLVAERSLPTGNPTDVTMSHTVIERATDAAIDVRDAT